MRSSQALCTDADAFSVSGSSPPQTAPARTPVVEHDARVQKIRFCGGFALERGQILDNATLAYSLVGPADAPIVVALGGISANRHVCSDNAAQRSGWWSELVGPDCAVDTCRYRVLSFDYLGGSNETLDPNRDPLPSITTGDQARALACLLDTLAIDRVALFLGASYGAMVGLRFAQAYPDRIEQLVAISGAHRPHPLATAWRSVQRNIVRLGLANNAPSEALALARALAMTTYRSSAEFAQRFDGKPTDVAGRVQFPVERYLEQRGHEFKDRFTPAAYLVLSESIDLHCVDPQAITCPTTVVGVTSDALVPFAHCDELAEGLAGPSECVRLDSLYGHDAFLKEIDALSPIVTRVLRAAGGVA